MEDDEAPGIWAIGSVVAIGALGAVLATTSVLVAFDEIGRELHAGIDTVQWVATAYLLGLASVVSATAWLARRVGARRLYLITLAAFGITSLLCAAASSISVLIALRVLQGMAGGAMIPVGQMMLATAAGPRRMGRVMGLVGVLLLMGPVLGPVVGGLLLESVNWHWVFLMNLPLVVTALVLGVWLLPAMPAATAGRFDTFGFVALVVSVPSLVFGLATAGRTGSFLEPGAILPVLVGLAFLAAFVRHAHRTAAPLLDLGLWRNRMFATCAVTALLVSVSQFGTMLLLPLYLQGVRGEGPFETGLQLAPQGIGTAISMTVAGRLTDLIGAGRVALAGVLILIASTFPFIWLSPEAPGWVLFALMVLRGLGAGGASMPAMAAAYITLAPSQIPDATPQLNLMQRSGHSIGSAVLATILASRLGDAAGVTADSATQVSAFDYAFVWATGLTAIAILPVLALLRVERSGRLRSTGTLLARS
jgi:EmrB/QacA subfamily drug resistance transporter